MTDWFGIVLGLIVIVVILLPSRVDPAIRFKEWMEGPDDDKNS